MSAIAIIPARGGSKRIARKNLKPFDGVPMIARSIATALRSGLFDQVLVSTDDPEIAELGRASGATVPFMRPAELADDFTGTGPVIVHALNTLRERGETFDYTCCSCATCARAWRRWRLILRSPSRFPCAASRFRCSGP